MLFGLMGIACLIANLHAAVFYVFFILMLPYIGEYAVILIRDSHFICKTEIKRLKKRIEKLVQKGAEQELLEGTQAKLVKAEERFEKEKDRAKQREENPYRIKLIRRDNVKWLLIVVVLCFAMGLLTPIGDEPYTHLFKLLSGTTTDSISEHQPIVLANHIPLISVLTIILGFLIFTDTKISLKDGFLLAGLIMLAFEARRQFSLLLIIGVMPLTAILCNFIGKYDKRRNRPN